MISYILIGYGPKGRYNLKDAIKMVQLNDIFKASWG